MAVDSVARAGRHLLPEQLPDLQNLTSPGTIKNGLKQSRATVLAAPASSCKQGVVGSNPSSGFLLSTTEEPR